MEMTVAAIWIVRRHPRHPYSSQRFPIRAFEIVATHAKAADAKADAANRNKKSAHYHFSVGRVALKESK
jgi:hypothetical protein